ncbi:ABC transporter permease [uncultured Paracoccus sp.]|uniref:ABC transporter permease n=1 Tax=uncultured Paracoccus sp. TaxID=189685 RepID=UPI0025FB84CD|nr:ABC transporter permease [uncultured Paracoccus sp.]
MAVTRPGPVGAGSVLLSFGLLLAAWWGTAASGLVSPLFLPGPIATGQALAELWANGTLQRDLVVSLGRAATGFAIGCTLGVATGILTGRIRPVRMVLEPVFTLLRPIPAIALVPLAIVWFGIGEGSKYFVISYTVFLAVWFNTHQGMDFIPEIYGRAARSIGVSGPREFLFVSLPAAAPHIFTGIRLGVALAFLSLIAAELSGASSGLGFRLQEARQYMRTDRMFALLILLGLLGATCDWLVARIGRRLIHW